MSWWWDGLAQLYQTSGSTDATNQLPIKKIKARCKLCRKRVTYKTGIHIFITDEIRLHIDCFNKRIDELIESGKIEELKDKETDIWYQY